VVFITTAVALTWGTLAFNAQLAWSAYSRRKIVSLVAAVVTLEELLGAEALPFVSQPGARLLLLLVMIAAQAALVVLSRRVVALQPVTDR
jgi:hypothetical protein